MATIIGIDLGTTNSEVAIVENGQPRVLEEDGQPILPSCVGFTEDGSLLVGQTAKNQYALAPERTVKSIKRKMGQDVKVSLGDQEFTPQEISAMILRALKKRAENQLGREVSKAVITVPAYFNDAQRQATREAGSLAGLEVVRIINEPTAAALTYNPDQTESQRILVYDLGGGTFDVSIVQVEDGVIEVLASQGDTELGGDDFDELLLNHVCERFEEEHGIDLRDAPTTKARVLQAVERAKRHLSAHPFATLEEEYIAEKDGTPVHLEMEVSRSDYEMMIQPMLDRTLESVQKALQDANVLANQLDKVILVGGSTRTPRVSEMLEERLGQEASQEVNPDLCVALGAAIQGAIVEGEDVGAVLVDIATHTMGIKALGGNLMASYPFIFAEILHRNTPLPASRSEVFTTTHDDQQRVIVEVYQGESRDPRENVQVGEFVIEGLAQVPAGNEILVQLDLNLDGMLKVTAREKSTGLQKHITIDNALARFEREEQSQAKERLSELWDDEESTTPTPALAPEPSASRETVQARALVQKAKGMLGSLAEEDRQDVEVLTKRIESTLSENNQSELTKASNELADMLFYLEEG